MNGNTNLEWPCCPRLQARYSHDNIQPCPDRALCIIFVTYRIAEEHQKSVTKKLCDVTCMTAYHCGAYRLVLTREIVQLFGIYLSGKFRRTDQITEHNRKTPAFGVSLNFRSGKIAAERNAATTTECSGLLIRKCAFRAEHFDPRKFTRTEDCEYLLDYFQVGVGCQNVSY